MAVKRIKAFDDWYVDREEDPRTGKLEFRGLDKCAEALFNKWQDYRREMDARVAEYYKLVMLADAEGSVETIRAKSPGTLGSPAKAIVLRFYGNADRADAWPAEEARGFGDWPVEVWGVNYPGFGRSEGSATLDGVARAADLRRTR